MRNPQKKLLTNRSLFNKNKDLSDPSPFSQEDQNSLTSANQSKNNKIQSESQLSNNTDTVSDISNSLADISESLSYSKEMVIEWIKHILPRPTPFTLMLSGTLYIIAICSTIHRQEGDRWLGVFLQARLPGCTKVCQEMSWETFENMISQYCNQNKFLPFKEDQSLQIMGSTIDQLPHKNVLGSSEKIYNTLITDIDLYKDQALIQLRSPWNKQLRKEFLGFFPEEVDIDKNLKESSLSNTQEMPLRWYKIGASNNFTRIIFPIQENNPTNSISSSQKDTLHLGEALTSAEADLKSAAKRLHLGSKDLDISEALTSSLPKEDFSIQENFKPQGEKIERRESTTLSDLPVHSLFPSEEDLTARKVLPSDQEISINPTELNDLDTLTLNPLAVSFNARYGHTRQNNLQFRDRLIPEKISGLQYLLPFNKKATYVESDSIPSKLDSPYLDSAFENNISIFNGGSIDSDLLSLLGTPRNRVNDKDLRTHFKNSLKNALHPNVISRENALKELFYLYGISAPDYLCGKTPTLPRFKENEQTVLKTGLDTSLEESNENEEGNLSSKKEKVSKKNKGIKNNKKKDNNEDLDYDANDSEDENDSADTSNASKIGSSKNSTSSKEKDARVSLLTELDNLPLTNRSAVSSSDSLKQWFTILTPFQKVENEKAYESSAYDPIQSGNTIFGNTTESDPTDSSLQVCTDVKSKSSDNTSNSSDRSAGISDSITQNTLVLETLPPLKKDKIQEKGFIEGLKMPIDPEDAEDQDNFSVYFSDDKDQEDLESTFSHNKNRLIEKDLFDNTTYFSDEEDPVVEEDLLENDQPITDIDEHENERYRDDIDEPESDLYKDDIDEQERSFSEQSSEESDEYISYLIQELVGNSEDFDENNEDQEDSIEDQEDSIEDQEDSIEDQKDSIEDQEDSIENQESSPEDEEDATEYQEVLAPNFLPNRFLSPRLMSGYNFPEMTKEETNSLFKQFLIPQVLSRPFVQFTPEQLLDRILLSPLHILVPPAVPLSLMKELAFPFLQLPPVSLREVGRESQLSNGLPESNTSLSRDTVPLDTSLSSAAELFDVDIQYRPVRLEELKEVKRIFAKLGRDYKDYLSRPTESPLAIAMSPSLEDDKLIEEQHKRILKARALARLQMGEDEVEPEYSLTQFEILEGIRENEKEFEKAKDFVKLACDTKLAYYPKREDNDFQVDKDLEPWITSNLGHKNMLSDRKYNFFGRMQFMSTKLPGKLQQDINESILNNGEPTLSRDHVAPRPGNGHPSKDHPGNGNPGKGVSLSVNQDKKRPTGSLPLRILEARAQKNLIYLLGAPDLEIHNSLGVQNRKHRPDPRLQLKTLKKVPYSRQGWQKRQMRSTLLGLPASRRVIMPEISVDQWKRMIELELKRYFLHEGRRLKSLVERNPEKTYKIKKINVYLPWVSIKKPLDQVIEWPLTRLDYSESPLPAQFYQSGMTELGSSFESEKLRVTELLQNQDKMGYPYECIPDTVNRVTFRYPQYKPIEYLSCRQFDTLSSTENWEIPKKDGLDKSEYNFDDGIRPVVLNQQLLFEPITNHSYLFIYRFFLALALKDVFKYIYRVAFKNFVLGFINSELGLRIISSKLRDRIKHAPPKSFYKPSKRLRDVAGAEDADTIPVLSEIIWSLRNRGRGRSTPRGVLVVGPSGTEKTSLIQAIAGEAQLPIIVQSLSALTLTYTKPYDRLQKAFNLARKKAPCVLFLDDLDAIGKSRSNVVNNYIGPKNSLLSLDPEIGETKLRLAHLSTILQTDLLPKKSTGSILSTALSSSDISSQNIGNNEETSFAGMGLEGNTDVRTSTLTTLQKRKEAEGVRINLLLQLLTEMDGIKGAKLDGVLIIATTEKPAILDPALLRPGRFDRRINLQFPNHQKRIELFKVETKKIGAGNFIPWDYLGIRTANMSGIDILSAINHSAIRAILDDTVHTVETLEHGLNCVLGLANKKIKSASLQHSDPFHTSRLAFYQAGRGVVQSLLVEHPKVGFLSLTEPVAPSLQSILMNNSHFGETRTSGKADLKGAAKRVHPGRTDTEYRLPKGLDVSEALGGIDQSQFKSSQGTQTQKSDNSIQNQIKTEVEKSITTYPTSYDSENEKYIEIQKKQDQIGKAYELATRQDDFLSSVTDRSSNHTQVISLPEEMRNSPFKDRVNSTQEDYLSIDKSYISSSTRTRIDLETRLVGLYAGKAGELLNLSANNVLHAKNPNNNSILSLVPQFNSIGKRRTDILPLEKSDQLIHPYLTEKRRVGWLWQSNLGFSEVLAASSLIHLMIDRWYLYSNKVFTFKSNKVRGSLNNEQMRNEQFFPIFQQLSKQLNSDKPKVGFWGHTHADQNQQNRRYGTASKKVRPAVKPIQQDHEKAAFWQAKVCQQLEMSERPYGKWYRIYLPKLDQNERNEEWVPPDTIFHPKVRTANVSLKRSTSTSSLKTLNDLYRVERDLQYQNAVINCFYTAFNLLNENRELLDLLADHLTRFKILRSYEISRICSLYLQSQL